MLPSTGFDSCRAARWVTPSSLGCQVWWSLGHLPRFLQIISSFSGNREAGALLGLGLGRGWGEGREGH